MISSLFRPCSLSTDSQSQSQYIQRRDNKEECYSNRSAKDPSCMPINEPPCRSQPITRLAPANGCRENILYISSSHAFHNISIVSRRPATPRLRSARSISSYILYSRRRQEQEIKIMRRNFEYFNPLSQYWGIPLQDEHHPSDSLTVADHDDDIETPSSRGSSSSPLSLTLR